MDVGDVCEPVTWDDGPHGGTGWIDLGLPFYPYPDGDLVLIVWASRESWGVVGHGNRDLGFRIWIDHADVARWLPTLIHWPVLEIETVELAIKINDGLKESRRRMTPPMPSVEVMS